MRKYPCLKCGCLSSIKEKSPFGLLRLNEDLFPTPQKLVINIKICSKCGFIEMTNYKKDKLNG